MAHPTGWTAYLHHFTGRQLIVVEDLNVKGMTKNKHLAKHIHDASWSEFMRQLDYKALWYGATIVKADRFYPSSKTCSGCGEVKAKLSLAERTFSCENCGVSVDRDVNAATNLARLGETSTPQSAAGEQGSAGTRSVAGRGGRRKTSTKQEKSSLVGAVASEASTLLTA